VALNNNLAEVEKEYNGSNDIKGKKTNIII
jgi:hypothetical protein